ncbi:MULTISPECIES: urea ABC transporter permease subunit UrtC [Rhodopseudomonas]|uniref:Urea ABC transporter permease n=1 Tax=Rhodopseudomonas palustris TaxID=1076 RepID=A0A0D7F4D4_RHOPL|nr:MULTISPECIES: urea ABC transporter permease subunit UrtC [Rhodopseudomonas]KIZ47641.1 urea ABC transporter permease [Rhodopseudomonas palustris]MDF3812549.1 urea ABC transporter permease subunit UrtC [Rhodopseudomonas sp. BAL398]WOK19864.1 urea ABC transporter permease subunit UrtC [Rhodopseudomonas sp. BAL398]
MNIYYNVKAQWAAYGAIFLLLAVVPMIVSDSFLLNQFATYGVFGMLALSLSLCWGFGGILNLGQGIPFGLGAYGMAMTMQMQTQDASNPMPPFMLNNSLDHLPMLWEPFRSTTFGIILALVVPTLFCLLFGGLMFRARVSGPFFAIMTLAMLSAWGTLILDVQPYTNGANGITPPAPLKLGELIVDPYSPEAYWSVLALLFVATVGAKLMTQSRFGLVVQAVRGDAERVRFLGYNVAGYETTVYTIAGFIAAVAGCCWVVLTQYVSPSQFDTTFSLSMVIWAGIGGRLSLIWSIIGAFLIQGAQSYLGDTFLSTWLLVLGGFFILVVRFLPKGIAGLVETILGRLSTRQKRNGADVAAHRLLSQPGE